MNSVRQVLQDKGALVYTITPQATVYQALELMAQKNIGAVVVLENNRVVGIFSERDYARKVVLVGKASKTTTVGEVMSRDVLYAKPDDSIEECMSLMTKKRHRHLPVMDGDKLIGLISIGDVVKAIISDREFTIRELERYITGGHTSQL